MAAPPEHIDLVAHGLVKGMPAAWMAGKETDLLAPLRLLATGTLPELAPLFPRIDKEKFMSEIKSSAPESSAPAAAAAAATPVATPPVTVASATTAVTSTEVSIDQFFATELKVGTVRFAERVPKSDKLIRLLVDLGEESPRQLVAGIGKAYAPEELVDRQVVVVANLKPAKLMGVESRGMILAATDAEGKPILVRPHAEGAANGTRVK